MTTHLAPDNLSLMSEISQLNHLLTERFPETEQHSAALPASGMSWLSHERVLSVTGADAKRFLQGQLTCDLDLLANPGSTLGARCNPKGRVQSSFRMLRNSEDSYLLAIHEDVLDTQRADLGKYAVFFKTTISDASDDWVRFGLWGPDAVGALEHAGLELADSVDQVAITSQGTAIRVPGADRVEIWLPADSASHTVDLLLSRIPAGTLNDWQLQQIRLGLGQISAATRESFIPQMLNLQLFSAVSFRKGCYTGQEIVARMQYLGKLKRRMFRLLMAGDAALPAGTPIVNPATGQTLGEVVMSAHAGAGVEILAVLQKDAAQLEALSAKDAEGPLLTLADLPYDKQLADSEVGTAN